MVKNLPANERDIRAVGLIPGSGRSSEGGHGNPLQYFAWRIPWTEKPGGLTVHRVTQNQTRLKRHSTHTHSGTVNTPPFPDEDREER